jgi:hypothetical protein
MNYLSRICPTFCKNPLSRTFLVVNFLVCAFIFDLSKVSSYIERIKERDCKPIAEKISFGFYDISASPLDTAYFPLNILFAVFLLLVFCLFMPSALATVMFVSDLKAKYAGWCPETFDLIEFLTFVFFNSLYWMILGYLIEIAHDYYRRNNSPREHRLSIYSNTN